MRPAKIIWIIPIVLPGSALICWVRNGRDFALPQALPLLGGYEPGVYDLAGFIMLLIAFWGIWRMRRR